MTDVIMSGERCKLCGNLLPKKRACRWCFPPTSLSSRVNRSLALFCALEQTRLHAYSVWPDGVPDGTPESVALGEAERALDKHDEGNGYVRRSVTVRAEP